MKEWTKHCVYLTGYICEEDVPISSCKLKFDISKGCPESCMSFKPVRDDYMGLTTKKGKPRCPVCGHDVETPITEEQLEEAYTDKFFEED